MGLRSRNTMTKYSDGNRWLESSKEREKERKEDKAKQKAGRIELDISKVDFSLMFTFRLINIYVLQANFSDWRISFLGTFETRNMCFW